MDGSEDQVELLRFLPKNPRFFDVARLGDGEHSQPELGFTRFFLAIANLLRKFLAGTSVVGFAIIRPNASSRLHHLTNERLGHDAFGECEGKPE